MALGTEKGGNIRHSGPETICAGAGSSWIVANDDASTAQTGKTLTPAAITDSTFHWVKRGNASKMLMRALLETTGATVSTSPAVYVMGMWGQLAQPEGDVYGPVAGARFMRLDNADSNASAITLTVVQDGTNLIFSSNAGGTDTVPASDPNSLTPIELKGCDYVGVVVVTAASVSAGAVPIEILLMQ